MRPLHTARLTILALCLAAVAPSPGGAMTAPNTEGTAPPRTLTVDDVLRDPDGARPIEFHHPPEATEATPAGSSGGVESGTPAAGEGSAVSPAPSAEATAPAISETDASAGVVSTTPEGEPGPNASEGVVQGTDDPSGGVQGSPTLPPADQAGASGAQTGGASPGGAGLTTPPGQPNDAPASPPANAGDQPIVDARLRVWRDGRVSLG